MRVADETDESARVTAAAEEHHEPRVRPVDPADAEALARRGRLAAANAKTRAIRASVLMVPPAREERRCLAVVTGEAATPPCPCTGFGTPQPRSRSRPASRARRSPARSSNPD